jgi:hypothetical protein
VTTSRGSASLPLCGPRDGFRGGGYMHANLRRGLAESWVRNTTADHDLRRRAALAIAGAGADAHVRRPGLCVRAFLGEATHRLPGVPRVSHPRREQYCGSSSLRPERFPHPERLPSRSAHHVPGSRARPAPNPHQKLPPGGSFQPSAHRSHIRKNSLTRAPLRNRTVDLLLTMDHCWVL